MASPMEKPLLIALTVAVSFGLMLGGVVVLVIFTNRKKVFASSLTHTQSLAGRIGTVQIPFGYDARGKIRLRINNQIEEVVAFTDYPHRFNRGDRILVVDVRNNQAWVIPQDFSSVDD